MIVWIENPEQWRYLRKITDYFSSRRFPVKTFGQNMGDFYKLVGYELIGYEKQEHWNYPFLYNVYYLRTYDDCCPDVQRCCYNDGGMPCEGQTVKELLEYAKAQASLHHCFECKKLHHPDNACHLYQVKHNFAQSLACENFASALYSDKETKKDQP